MTERGEATPEADRATLFDRAGEAARAGQEALAGLSLFPPLELERSRPDDAFARKSPARLPWTSEGELVRHYTRLSTKNRAVDTGPIALGTLTAKVTPRILDEIAAFHGFSDIHPALPVEFAQGALEVLYRLSSSLTALSGLDACSVQPGPAAHAMLSGLNAVRAFHEGHGSVRKIVLVPDTVSPAAFWACRVAGYEPMPVAIGREGYVSPDLVAAAIERHGRDIAAMIVATPNTLGLFQPHITEIADELHAIGAQMYLDGGNLNALIGIVKPRDMGFDVMHFDLRTFGVASEGRGAESSAVASREHLAPYLPGPRVVLDKQGAQEGAKFRVEPGAETPAKVAALFGNFGAHVRALAYLARLGTPGLLAASRAAVLNANYLKRRLADTFEPVADTPSFHNCVFGRVRESLDETVASGGSPSALLGEGRFPAAPVLYGAFARALCLEPTETETIDELDRLAKAYAALATKRGETFDSARSQTERLEPLGPDDAPVLSIDDR